MVDVVDVIAIDVIAIDVGDVIAIDVGDVIAIDVVDVIDTNLFEFPEVIVWVSCYDLQVGDLLSSLVEWLGVYYSQLSDSNSQIADGGNQKQSRTVRRYQEMNSAKEGGMDLATMNVSMDCTDLTSEKNQTDKTNQTVQVNLQSPFRMNWQVRGSVEHCDPGENKMQRNCDLAEVDCWRNYSSSCLASDVDYVDLRNTDQVASGVTRIEDLSCLGTMRENRPDNEQPFLVQQLSGRWYSFEHTDLFHQRKNMNLLSLVHHSTGHWNDFEHTDQIEIRWNGSMSQLLVNDLPLACRYFGKQPLLFPETANLLVYCRMIVDNPGPGTDPSKKRKQSIIIPRCYLFTDCWNHLF